MNEPVALGIQATKVAVAWNKPTTPGTCGHDAVAMYPVSVFDKSEYVGIHGPFTTRTAMQLCDCTNCAFAVRPYKHAVGPYAYFTIHLADGSGTLEVRGNRLWAVCGVDTDQHTPTVFYIDAAYCVRTIDNLYFVWNGTPGDAFTTSDRLSENTLRWLPARAALPVSKAQTTANASCSSTTQTTEPILDIPNWLQKALDARAGSTSAIGAYADGVVSSPVQALVQDHMSKRLPSIYYL